MTNRIKLAVIFVAALIGLADAGWLSVTHLSGGAVTAPCGPGTCGGVLSSSYAQVLGIPLAYVGLAYYAMILAVSFSLALGSERLALWPFRAMSVAGLGFSMVLLAVQGFVLRAFCPLCTLSAIMSAVIAASAIAIRSRAAVGDVRPVSGRDRSLRWLSAVGGLASLVLITASLPREGKPSKHPVARVADRVITDEELDEALRAPISQLDQQRYAMKLDWIDTEIKESMYRLEAARQGISPDSLLRREINARVLVSEEAIDAYHRERYAGSELPEDVAKDDIRRFMMQDAWEARRRSYTDSLTAAYRPQLVAVPGESGRRTVSTVGAHIVGPEVAPVDVVVFADFQCEHCTQLLEHLKAVPDLFDGRVRVALKHFPLPGHRMSVLRAEAAECAGEQGHFWAYHDSVLVTSDSLSADSLIARAHDMGMDQDRFRNSLLSHKFRKKIEEDRREGLRHGVRSTPSVFVAGRALEPGFTPEMLRVEIELALAEKRLAGSIR